MVGPPFRVTANAVASFGFAFGHSAGASPATVDASALLPSIVLAAPIAAISAAGYTRSGRLIRRSPQCARRSVGQLAGSSGYVSRFG
jgi:hypothetical protein